MKKLFIITLFTLAFLVTCSQGDSYIPLVKENTQWNMYDVQGGGQCYDEHIDTLLKKYTIKGDTVINNIPCKKFCKIGPVTLMPQGIGGIREENRKIYYAGDTYANKYGESIQECLLYDFTAQAGDVVSMNSEIKYTVSKVDFMEINGNPRKRYKVESRYGSEYIVEGIGNITTGILQFITPIPTCIGYHQEFRLICYSENNMNVYKNPEFNDCNSLERISAGINNTQNFKFTIIPNPSKDYIRFSMKELTGENIRLNLLDNTGKIIFTKNNVENNEVISLDFLPKGIYLVQIETKTVKETHKIVKQ